MSFQGIQRTYSYTQFNHGNINDVFPLLCPVREADWLDGWTYKMIHSNSGKIEKDCVFTTPHHGKFETIWHVTQHNSKTYQIEFVRLTPNENVVKITIQLEKIDSQSTEVQISYQYTALNEAQNRFITEELEKSFIKSMQWWEKAINHYLKYGTMLKQN